MIARLFGISVPTTSPRWGRSAREFPHIRHKSNISMQDEWGCESYNLYFDVMVTVKAVDELQL